jgi:predicted acylesterase/phospholipase RssA
MLTLVAAGYKPKLSLGASGGAMVAAQAVLNNWNAGIWADQLVGQHDVALLQKHYLGELQALVEASIYQPGSGLVAYYDLLSSGNYAAFRANEIIINAYNTDLGRTELFSTARRQDSVLNSAQGPLLLLGVSSDVHFLGDLPDSEFGRQLRQALAATSAVPIVFDRVPFGQYLYADGGVSFSSPLTAVSCVYQLPDILYINPTDIDKQVPAEYGSVKDNAIAYTAQITRSNALQDRYMHLHSLCCGVFANMAIIRCVYNPVTFAADLAATAGRPRMVELYPLESANAPMTVMQSYDQYMSQIAAARTGFAYRIFYVR